MIVLVVGAESDYAIERSYTRYLSSIDGLKRLIFFKAQNLFLEHYNRSVFHKILYRAGLSPVLHEINKQLKQIVEDTIPDVIVVFKGMEVFPDTLRWARSKDIKLVNYNPDNPFIFSGRGSGNANLSRSVGLYDLYLTYDTAVRDQILEKFTIRSSILPFGFDIRDGLYEDCRQQREIMAPCFVGSPDKIRASFLEGLAHRGVIINVYGHHWKKFVKSKNLKLHEAVYGDEFWRTLSRYRVQLNIMRPHNLNSHNMRTFEIAGIGGIQLAPDTPDHRTYFRPGAEIFLYQDLDQCVMEIQKILDMPETDADQVRLSARVRSLQDGYAYADRAMQLYGELQKVLNE